MSQSSESTRRSAVFAKEPLPGQVKTRLEPVLGAVGAAELQTSMIEDLLDLHQAAGAPLGLAVHPVEAVERMRAAFPMAAEVVAQQGADLGERLAHWFESGPTGHTQVVLGADCPFVEASLVARAHELLEQGADAVFAPDGGGGYCLVGMRVPAPGLFEGVPMSTENNLVSTLDEAQRLGLAVQLLPVRGDVDTPVDLPRLQRDLNTAADRKDAHYPARTAATLARLLECTPSSL
ncbi:MAG: rSAM/selenodomain-associated transferase 1 [Planctomycetota bacterium]|jgi:rSAM/selenodomain-associated transferase 1